LDICIFCGSSGNLTKEHVMPKWAFGNLPEKGFKTNNVKVTINLSKSSLDFFKKLAKQHGSQYQKVIRNLLDSYSSFYSRSL